MNKKELTLSDLKNVRGGLALGKWKKSEKTETDPIEGVPTCKCHTETSNASPAAAGASGADAGVG
ncbi:MAG: hypothetical protein K0V04_29035 [Deltaproteobacteria bacterium]|nr:hypothetical protein [Deltaproteobacteria bacterium]